MSVRINKLLPFAVAALGVSITPESAPVLEGLLNDYTVSAVHIAQVDDAGRCIMIVDCMGPDGVSKVRTVASSNGDIKLFADLAGAQATILRAKFAPNTAVTFKRKEKSRSLGDPVMTLKTLYKAFKAEKMVGEKARAVTAAKITAATALGWNTAVGTLEAAEFADYMEKQASVGESIQFATARITALAASLTAAGVDPATVV